MERVGRDVVDDQVIIEAYRHDPAEGFALLVRRESAALFGVLRAFSRSQEDATDAVAESFLRAYRALASYPDNRIGCLMLRPWLYRIGINVAKSRHRSDQARMDREARSELSRRGQADLSAEDVYWRDEVSELEEMLRALPGPTQAVLLLRYLHGFTNSEVAEILSISEESVRTRAHRGIQRLRARTGYSEGSRDGCES
jgi:RNA polymerase sigma-70 factor (ECF subfamily)